MRIMTFLLLAAFVMSAPAYGGDKKDIELDVSGAAQAVKEGAKEAGRGIKSTVKDKKLRKSLKKAGRETKEALKETGRAIKKEIPVEVEKK